MELISRPTTLAEIVDHSPDYLSFGMSVRDFIGELKLTLKRGGAAGDTVVKEPALLRDRFPEGVICDAFLAGLADHLAETHHFAAPTWTAAKNRLLDAPWYPTDLPSFRAYIVDHALPSFRQHNIFTDASSLDRL